MVILNAVKQLINLNYHFIKEKFRVKLSVFDPKNNKFETVFNKKEVLNGTFKGLKYTGFHAVCSAVYPKLLGSYEQEIQHDLLEIILQKPSLIIDIGCAEGYYAVGVAMLLPDSHVIAADTLEEARKLCGELADLNRCTNVSVLGKIDLKELIKYDLKNAFIICDCEGYEKELFSAELLPYLRDTFLIIETHDFIDPSISIYLETLFRETHLVKVVSSTDDLQKVKYYDYAELKNLSFEDKKEILSEYRPTIMEWLILTPINA